MKILSDRQAASQFQLYSAIRYFRCVGSDFSSRDGYLVCDNKLSGSNGDGNICHDVCSFFIIKIKFAIELPVEHRPVESDIDGIGMLPTHVRVTVGSEACVRYFGIPAYPHHLNQRIHGSCCIGISVSSVGNTRAKVIQPMDRFHKVLVCHVPAKTDRPERRITVFGVIGYKIGRIGTIRT